MRSVFVGGVAAAAVLCLAGQASAAEVVTVRSFDGTKINAQFTPARGLAPGQKAPVILMTHGFAGTRETVEFSAPALGQVGAGDFRNHGYSTLTWDSRGFGRSGGEVTLDNPATDGRDVSALIDYLATRPDVQLDGPGDPRIGMHGASYGGGIQWATAINDQRIDALAPAISFTDLRAAIARDGRLKLPWGAVLVGGGYLSALGFGVIAPQGPELGAMPASLVLAAVQSGLQGTATPQLDAYLEASSTVSRLGSVRAPTLILHGTADTIFSPSQAIAMREGLRPAGVPVKMLWFCGGHGVCLTGEALAGRVIPTTLAWMDRWVKGDASVDTGPGFEWVADDGNAYAAPDFPRPVQTTLTATGSGFLPLVPGSSASGLGVLSTPAAVALNIDLPRTTSTLDVVGEPRVRIRYRGTATGGRPYLFAHLVDLSRGVVVGNQVTPIPLTLDGKAREVFRPLEGVAMRMWPGRRYRLQLFADSTVYGIGRSVGLLQVTRADVWLDGSAPAP